jgi:hypothetical protein
VNSRKIAALAALVPLLALALTGLSLAHWDDQVDLQGSVSLGTFNIQMSLDDTSDNEGAIDVGTITATLGDYNDGDDVIDAGTNDMLTVTIANMYPGYEACVYFDIDNVGSIPAETTSDAFTSVTKGSSFDWGTYGAYVNMTLYYLPTSGSPVMIFHQDYTTGGTIHVDYDFSADPNGILYLNNGEAEHFMLCIGLNGSADHNAPEDIMGQSFTFSMAFDWVQAVPTSG